METILEEENDDGDRSYLDKVEEETLDLYLNMIENTPNRKGVLEGLEEGFKVAYDEEPRNNDDDSKLRVHSKIRREIGFREEDVDHIKAKMRGLSIVLLLDDSKKLSYESITNRYSVLVQYYTNVVNFESQIRDKRANLVVAVVDRKILESIGHIKATYPNIVFIFENINNDDIPERLFDSIDCEIDDVMQLDRLLAEMVKEN